MGKKTDWIMHEYRLESEENGPPQEEGWVVCRAFKKRATTGQMKNSIEGWDSTYYYDEPNNALVTSMDSNNIDSITRHQKSSNFLPQNLVCKQETEAATDNNNLHFIHSDHFIQLPQLESPSLPPMKRPISLIATEFQNSSTDQEDDQYNIMSGISNSKKVTDWRDLDRFVASQLSHGEGLFDVGPSSFDQSREDDSGLELLLLQSGTEEAAVPKLDEIPTASDCDIGICMFNK